MQHQLRPSPDLPEAFVDRGYRGDPEAWCWWDAEYPEEGSCGPFVGRQAAVEDLERQGFMASTADITARATIS